MKKITYMLVAIFAFTIMFSGCTGIITGHEYKKEDLVNLHTCIKSNVITIIAGMSGTGKTQLALSYAEMLDLDEENMGECRGYSKEIKVYTGVEEVTRAEFDQRTAEIISHEVLHAYLNEAGLDLGEEAEERMCDFYMKNWRKLSNTILDVLDDLKIGI